MKFLYNDDVNLHHLSIHKYGVCTICGEHLNVGCKTYAGKLIGGNYAIACGKCKAQVVNLSKEYVFYEQEIALPPQDAKLWRYQDFAKFVSLLDSKKLFFTRADSFDDPFECARGYNFQKKAIYEKIDNYLRLKATTQLMDSGTPNPSGDEIAVALDTEKEKYLLEQEEKRKCYYISCWHENARESEGMWKLYTTVLSQGVAIQTTAQNLCCALDNDSFEIGKVKYTNYDKPLDEGQVPVWYKRDTFNHEHEVRVVIKNMSCIEKGMRIPVDLDILIEKVYVSPTASPWFADLIKNIMLHYGLNKPVLYSQLNDKPIY